MELSGMQETISTRGKIFPARSRMVGSVSGKSIMVPRIKPLGRRANRAHRITNPARGGKAQKDGMDKVCAGSGQFQWQKRSISERSQQTDEVPGRVPRRARFVVSL